MQVHYFSNQFGVFFLLKACPAQSFVCDATCHPDYLKCDGVSQCSDESDEKNCLCEFSNNSIIEIFSLNRH